jgi:hypothetical protein
VLIFGNIWYLNFKAKFFQLTLINFIFPIKDPISSFARYIQNSEKDKNLLEIWNQRIKITPHDLKHNADIILPEISVTHRPDLAKKYLNKFVSCSEQHDHINLLNDTEIKIIKKNKSVILIHNDKPVGAIIRDAALKHVKDHFGAKIKTMIAGHPVLNRGKSHRSNGPLVAHGTRPNRLNSGLGSYVYKVSNPEEQKILDNNGSTLAWWLFEYGKCHLPWTTISYEEFKNQVNLDEGEIIGAVFCAKNYEAVGHIDNDRSEVAVGYVYEEGIVKEGYFFYPEYGVAIEMTSNSIWCWLPQAVHGTAKLDLSEGGTRYTAAITLTERTAKAIERNQNNKK